MNRFARLVVCVALTAGACSSSSEAETLPTIRLTTTTAEPTTTEAPTTTEPSTTSTTSEPTTSSTTVVEQFDPETAQAEIAALLEDFTEFWTFNNETPDPNDPRLDELFIGDQRDRIRTLFEDVSAKGQLANGTTVIRAYGPPLLTPSNQTAFIATCRFGQVELLESDGSVVIPADDEALEHSFEFRFADGRWRIEAYGKSSGRDIPCDI